MNLPYKFDLWLDIKTLEQLEYEFNYHNNKVILMEQLMNEHGIVVKKRGKRCKIYLAEKDSRERGNVQ
jgi:hypothetical protein